MGPTQCCQPGTDTKSAIMRQWGRSGHRLAWPQRRIQSAEQRTALPEAQENSRLVAGRSGGQPSITRGREIWGPAIDYTANEYCVEFAECGRLSVSGFDSRFVGGRQMARTNRRDVLAAGEIQVVHCINRCVRRA